MILFIKTTIYDCRPPWKTFDFGPDDLVLHELHFFIILYIHAKEHFMRKSPVKNI